jgi:ubiquinone biosynthesis protein UbiJ
MSDVLGRLIIDAFNNVIKREIAEADEVRAEIKQRGTYWAGDEIWKLRRQVASLRKRLAEYERDRQ